jgi:hypothetical protein
LFENKTVVCDLSQFKNTYSKILGVVTTPLAGNRYILEVNTLVTIDGEYRSTKYLQMIDKNLCSVDETVDEINVINDSREGGKEISGSKSGSNLKNKASKQ